VLLGPEDVAGCGLVLDLVEPENGLEGGVGVVGSGVEGVEELAADVELMPSSA